MGLKPSKKLQINLPLDSTPIPKQAPDEVTECFLNKLFDRRRAHFSRDEHTYIAVKKLKGKQLENSSARIWEAFETFLGYEYCKPRSIGNLVLICVPKKRFKEILKQKLWNTVGHDTAYHCADQDTFKQKVIDTLRHSHEIVEKDPTKWMVWSLIGLENRAAELVPLPDDAVPSLTGGRNCPQGEPDCPAASAESVENDVTAIQSSNPRPTETSEILRGEIRTVVPAVESTPAEIVEHQQEGAHDAIFSLETEEPLPALDFTPGGSTNSQSITRAGDCVQQIHQVAAPAAATAPGSHDKQFPVEGQVSNTNTGTAATNHSKEVDMNNEFDIYDDKWMNNLKELPPIIVHRRMIGGTDDPVYNVTMLHFILLAIVASLVCKFLRFKVNRPKPVLGMRKCSLNRAECLV